MLYNKLESESVRIQNDTTQRHSFVLCHVMSLIYLLSCKYSVELAIVAKIESVRLELLCDLTVHVFQTESANDNEFLTLAAVTTLYPYRDHVIMSSSQYNAAFIRISGQSQSKTRIFFSFLS